MYRYTSDLRFRQRLSLVTREIGVFYLLKGNENMKNILVKIYRKKRRFFFTWER